MKRFSFSRRPSLGGKPLTACQVAPLQAWLGEPVVTQPDRADDTDPAGTALFAMPLFN